MAWNVPRADWSPSELLTASDMNNYVLENTAWLGTSRPHCQVRDAAATAAASSAWTAVSWAAPTTNVGTMAVQNGSYVRATTAGFYLVGASAVFAGNTTNGIRAIMLSSGSAGSGTVYAQSNTTQHGANPSGVSVMTGIQLEANADVYLSIASSDTTTDAVTNIRMWATWVTT